MKLALSTYSTDLGYNGGFDYAIVDVPASLILERKARLDSFIVISQDRTLSEMAYLGPGPTYCRTSELEKDATISLVDNITVLPDDFKLFEHPTMDRSTEYDQMVIGVHGVYWRTSPHDSDIDITTELVTYEFLAEVATTFSTRATRRRRRAHPIAKRLSGQS
jgi:hypothetical protein